MKRSKKNQSDILSKNEKPSKQYTIDELIELGKKNNNVKLAPPLFEKKNSNKGIDVK